LNKQWVGFDDLNSVTLKVLNYFLNICTHKLFFFPKVLYAQSLNLGGVMLWSLDQDDYIGLFCGEGEFPLTRRVYDVLRLATNSFEQELVSSSVATKLSTEKNSLSIELDTSELTSTQLSSDWNIVNSSAKHLWSFYLFFIVLLSV
jgi:hypothetical protein